MAMIESEAAGEAHAEADLKEGLADGCADADQVQADASTGSQSEDPVCVRMDDASDAVVAAVVETASQAAVVSRDPVGDTQLDEATEALDVDVVAESGQILLDAHAGAAFEFSASAVIEPLTEDLPEAEADTTVQGGKATVEAASEDAKEDAVHAAHATIVDGVDIVMSEPWPATAELCAEATLDADQVITARLQVGAPGLATVRNAFEEHIWPSPCFSSRLEGERFADEREERLDAAYHFVEVPFEDEAAIDAFVERSRLAPLDASRPPWRLFFLRVAPPAHSDVLLRLHRLLAAEAQELARLETALQGASVRTATEGTRERSRSRSPKRVTTPKAATPKGENRNGRTAPGPLPTDLLLKLEPLSESDAPARFLQETTTMLAIDSNKSGGGALFRGQHQVLVAVANRLPDSLRNVAEEQLEFMWRNFKGNTPCTYRSICTDILSFLSDNGVV